MTLHFTRQPSMHECKYLQMPWPIARCVQLERLEREVWCVIYSWAVMEWTDLSNAKIAKSIRTDRRNVQRAIDSLEAKGFLRRHYKTKRNGVRVVDYELLWPDSLEIEPWDVIKKCLRNCTVADDEPHTGGAVSRRRGVRSQTAGGCGPTPQGGRSETSPIKETTNQTTQKSSHESRKQSFLPSKDGAAVEEMDQQNKEAALREINSDVEPNDLPVEVKPLPRQRRSPSNGDQLRRPSERWEFTRWREKTNRYSGTDLVGYWICRYRETQGEEDHAFFVDTLKNPEFVIKRRNAVEFYRKWLDSSWKRWRETVDLVLSKAKDAGNPVAFRYFFTPSSSSAVESLVRGYSRKKTMTPREKDDLTGVDMKAWSRERELQAKRQEID